MVTGSRAEFGLMRWLMKKIKASDDLSSKFSNGNAPLSRVWSHYLGDRRSWFSIDEGVECCSVDSKQAISKSMGIGLIGISDALDRLRPDLLVLTGDRFEIFTAAIASMYAGIPWPIFMVVS